MSPRPATLAPSLLALSVVLLAARPAHALEPWLHRKLAVEACVQAGVVEGFCRRVSQAAHDTDAHEWELPAAHGQRAPGQAACAGANAAIDRVAELAAAVRAAVRRGDVDGAATRIGRILHTVQDECAHHGMTNPQHAYLSVRDVCEAGDFSPDDTPEAAACATTVSREIMAQMAVVLVDAPAGPMRDLCIDADGGDPCARATLPTPVQGCEFLAEHEAWDGADSRWDGAVVGSALMDAVSAGLAGRPAPWRCSDEAEVAATDPDPTVNPYVRVCRRLDLACLGKVDEGGGVDGEAEISASCAAGGGRGGAWPLALALLLLGRPRRRRR